MRAAFLRFCNAPHEDASFADVSLGPVTGQVADDDRALLDAALARLPKAEHRLVVAFIAEPAGGTLTCFLRVRLIVRDRIDSHAGPAGPPGCRRPDPVGR